MASGFADYGENKGLDAIYGGVSMGGGAASTAPTTWYIGLFTAAAGESGGGTEVTGGNYSRIAVTNNTTNFPSASGGSKTNGVAFTSAVSSASWGTIVGIGIHDASTAGNMWAYADIAGGDQQNINAANQQWSLPIGALTLTLA